MPRQKFCSVPGCLSTTDVIKREQESFLSAYCDNCRVQRPCRCPAPDIYTTRRETRTKFASWCSAIGLRSPGYYINVCYKHFSSGCPSRTCPNPDVVKPVWEKHIRDKMSGITKTLTSGATPVNKKVVPAVTMAGKKRRAVMVPDPPATISTSSKIVIKAARTGSPGMPSPAPPPPVSTTATTSASGTTNDAVSTTQCTTVMNVAGTGSSLLRDALMLPKSPLPRAIISLNNNVKGTTTFLHHNYASLPLLRDEHRESTSASKTMVKPTSINPHTSIPTTIALPQTPVPLNQLTSMANSSIQYAVSTSSPLTPPSSFSSTSSLLTKDEDEDFNDIKEELNLDDLDEIMLMGLMESTKTPSSDADLIVKDEPPGSTTTCVMGDAIADLPLLDQSEDPYLNDGSDPLSSVLFGSDELDSTVHKWMEACESNLLPL